MVQPLVLTVNGRTWQVQVAPETPLLYVLRNDLHLKGAKFGCGLEQCGACLVIIDGEATPSCRLPVATLHGKTITTVEGLGTLEKLHPIQQAFLDEQAAQCGFCTAGLIVAATALLDRQPQPSDSEIRQSLARNLCRCGAHPRVVRAVQRAAQEMKS
jgi:nicotinate dehydrogenase subunit A